MVELKSETAGKPLERTAHVELRVGEGVWSEDNPTRVLTMDLFLDDPNRKSFEKRLFQRWLALHMAALEAYDEFWLQKKEKRISKDS